MDGSERLHSRRSIWSRASPKAQYKLHINWAEPFWQASRNQPMCRAHQMSVKSLFSSLFWSIFKSFVSTSQTQFLGNCQKTHFLRFQDWADSVWKWSKPSWQKERGFPMKWRWTTKLTLDFQCQTFKKKTLEENKS